MSFEDEEDDALAAVEGEITPDPDPWPALKAVQTAEDAFRPENWPPPALPPVVASYEAAVAAMLRLRGLDPADPSLLGTPARVSKAYFEMTAGYEVDVPALLSTRFHGNGYDQMVLLRAIDFASLCEHHLLPFVGRAHVAYVPNHDVVGLSKLARIVDAFARRLQIQERLTMEIADALDQHLKPRGVAVVLEASHSCMGIRGVGKPSAVMTTSDVRGCFRTDPAARAEFFSAIR